MKEKIEAEKKSISKNESKIAHGTKEGVWPLFYKITSVHAKYQSLSFILVQRLL